MRIIELDWKHNYNSMRAGIPGITYSEYSYPYYSISKEVGDRNQYTVAYMTHSDGACSRGEDLLKQFDIKSTSLSRAIEIAQEHFENIVKSLLQDEPNNV